MGQEQEIDYNPNKQSYSCIGRLENNYKDLSFEKLKSEIIKSVKSIKKDKNKKISIKNKLIQKEYNILEKYIDFDKEHLKNLKKGFRDLCRYRDIKPYEYNSIEINTEKKFINASPINIYSNSNLIATQGPMSNTIEDFWIMVDQYKCNIIIMLCNLIEENKQKCAYYWDIKNEMMKFKINIISKEEKKFSNNIIIIRQIKLINKETNIEKNITQIQYLGWPDNNIPLGNGYFEAFNFMFGQLEKLKGDGSGIIHCSAGVGRTGTFIASYFLFKEINDQIKDINLKKINFSVFNIVRKLKELRLNMVQNVDQYKFIYNFVNYLLIKIYKI